MITYYKSRKIVTPSKIIDGYMAIEDSNIKEIFSSDYQCENYFDYSDEIIIPGLIDLHTHGFMGWNASKAENYENVLNMAECLLSQGITAFLPTIIASKSIENVLEANMKAIELQKTGAKILGMYLEGPFYNKTKSGGTPIEFFKMPSLELLEKYIRISKNNIVCMGISPELKGAMEVICYLKENNVIASIAHTNATIDQTQNAIRKGCSLVTHTFNAMNEMNHRDVGVAGYTMIIDQIFSEINCDFMHVSKEMLDIFFKCKTKNKICIISDNDYLTGYEPGKYITNGEVFIVDKNKTIRKSDNTIYGSGKSLLDAICLLDENLKIPLHEIVNCCSKNIADLLGNTNLGALEKNKKADFAILDSNYNCICTYIDGIKVFDSKSSIIKSNKNIKKSGEIIYDY